MNLAELPETVLQRRAIVYVRQSTSCKSRTTWRASAARMRSRTWLATTASATSSRLMTTWAARPAALPRRPSRHVSTGRATERATALSGPSVVSQRTGGRPGFQSTPRPR